MPETLQVGRQFEVEWLITESRLATAYKNPGVEVFGTPGMVEMMELAAVECVLPCLPAGHGSVGVKVNVDHIASTPLGAKVQCRAWVTAIEGRKIRFEMEARSGGEIIGRGMQERVVVELQRFVAKANAKLKPAVGNA